jgi:adenylate cyclase
MQTDEELRQMIRISYLPDARDVEASAGDTILHAALRAGIRLTHACGSNARCSTCRVAILFVDIRGFTAFAERLLPYDVIHALNRYYHQIGRIVHRRGGIIDNYMGDGILTVFGLEETERVVSPALQAGLDMLQAVEAMKPYFQALHGRSFDIGIGLHYGAVVIGSIGWGAYKRRTVVGDAVNFASRIEAANKTVGSNFLISEEAYFRAGHEVEVNQCPPWEIRGKTGVFQLYEVVGTKAHSS